MQCLCVGVIRAGILTVKYLEDGRVIVASAPSAPPAPRPAPESVRHA